MSETDVWSTPLMIHPLLDFFGICTGAVTVYLTALKSGDASISKIARKAHLPRSSAKRYVEQLLERGLLRSFVKRKSRMIVATPPDRVKQIFEERTADFSASIPQLKRLANASNARMGIRFYEGARELRAVYDSMLAEQKPIDAVTSPDDTFAVLGKFFERFIQRRIEKKIPLRLLAPDTPGARKFREADPRSFRNTQFLASGLPFHTATYIYGDKVAIIALRSANPAGVIINDPFIAESQRMLFKLLWDRKGIQP